MTSLAELYQQLLNRDPALHQNDCWMILKDRKPVILRAPTGSGKTEALVLPFLALGGYQLPNRLLYALPLRSLANQIVKRIKDYAVKLGRGNNWRVSLQHGEAPESVLFAADAVVATIDQVITSYACAPLTLPVRHGNIPAGAVVSSFVVFDEVHLFDPELGLQATRLICERLNRLGIPYAVLSATLPDSVIEFWRDKLGARVVEAYSEFIRRQVAVEWRNSSMTPDEVRRALAGKAQRILVVCNTVDRAINLFEEVKNLAEDKGYVCNLLHSRFLSTDRDTKEEWVIQHFGKSPQDKALLVATQVVEVGLDISADLLLTELAPIDALIQRAGRIARWGGDGKVWIYDVESASPYKKELVEKTKDVLQRNSLAQLDWATARRWVNQVLSDFYWQILNEDNAYEQVVAQLSRAAFEGNCSRAEAAVRDINTVEVTICSDPQGLGKDVVRLPTISVHIGTAKKWIKEAIRSKFSVWRVGVDRSPSDAEIQINLENVATERDILIGDRLIFPSSVLAYSGELGLRCGQAHLDFQPQFGRQRQCLSSGLRRESWIEHSIRVVQRMEDVLRNEMYAVLGLALLLSVKPEEVMKAAKLAALFHDLGKLNKEWQKQAGISDSANEDELLAHTDQRAYEQFPAHATVSAYALWPALVDNQTSHKRILARAICFAIAHHHSVRAREVPPYEFHVKWRRAVEEALKESGLDGSLDLNKISKSQPSPTDLRDRFPPLEYEKLYTAYILISRWLRLADRIATGGEDAILHYENWFGRL